MKAQELRIGNWVQGKVSLPPYEGVKLLHQVNSMMIRDCEHYKDDWSCEPIPLTPEILEKCGFYQLPHPTIQNLWIKNIGRGRVISIACVGTPNEMVFINEEEPPTVKNIIVVRNYDYDGKTYLHHIQNIVHSFTGEELEFKP